MKTYQVSKGERMLRCIIMLPLLLCSVIATLAFLHIHPRWLGASTGFLFVLTVALGLLLLLRFSWGVFNGMVSSDAEGVAVRSGKRTEQMRWADVKAVSSLDDAWVLEDGTGRQLKGRCPTRGEENEDFF